MRVIEFLVKNNYVTQEKLNVAMKLQKRNKNQYIGEILIKMNVITEEQLIEYVCEYDTKVIMATYG